MFEVKLGNQQQNQTVEMDPSERNGYAIDLIKRIKKYQEHLCAAMWTCGRVDRIEINMNLSDTSFSLLPASHATLPRGFRPTRVSRHLHSTRFYPDTQCQHTGARPSSRCIMSIHVTTCHNSWSYDKKLESSSSKPPAIQATLILSSQGTQILGQPGGGLPTPTMRGRPLHRLVTLTFAQNRKTAMSDRSEWLCQGFAFHGRFALNLLPVLSSPGKGTPETR